MANKSFRALALLMAAFALSSILFVACARPGSPTAKSSGSSTPSASTGAPANCPSGDTVKTGTSTFEQTCIALAKGATLKVVPAVTNYHILDYGSWNNGTAQPQTAPAGAPALKGLIVQASAVTIGPFTTAGTYKIYCTVHTGMNLTVVVK
jgi:plastocyanin